MVRYSATALGWYIFMFMKKRDSTSSLLLSLRFAKEYLDELNRIYKTHLIDEIQESREISITQRALWVALIIEIGCLFDTYSSKDKEIISLKKIVSLKKEIDRIHGEKVIGQIITTRNTFTAHKAVEKTKVISPKEIIDSNLSKLLNELSCVLLK